MEDGRVLTVEWIVLLQNTQKDNKEKTRRKVKFKPSNQFSPTMKHKVNGFAKHHYHRNVRNNLSFDIELVSRRR